MDIEKLRFPIGKYSPGEIKFEHISEWIDDIENLPSQLDKLLADTREDDLAYTYRPDGWNIRQLVHHLADSHMNSIIRFKLALTEDAPTIKPYLEAKWAELHDVREVPIEASMQILRGVHARLTSLLKDMSVKEFNRTFVHPESGRSLDLAYNLGMYAWHGKHHLAHIKNALKEKKTDWK